MRNATFSLEPGAELARPPFRYDYVPARRSAFWRVREESGRAIGQALTRNGARAAVRHLYQLVGGAA